MPIMISSVLLAAVLLRVLLRLVRLRIFVGGGGLLDDAPSGFLSSLDGSRNVRTHKSRVGLSCE